MSSQQLPPSSAITVTSSTVKGSPPVPDLARNMFSRSAREAAQLDLAPVPVRCEFDGAHFHGYVFNKPGQNISFGQADEIGALRAQVTHPSHKARVCDVFLVKTGDQKTFRLSFSPGDPDPTLTVLDMNSGKRSSVPVPGSADLKLEVGGSLRFAPQLANTSIASIWAIENRSSQGFDHAARPSQAFVLQGRRLDGPATTSAPSTSTIAPRQERAVKHSVATGFKTAKGSTYQLQEDGTTIRDKAARNDVGHEGDYGVKARSARTIYVDCSAHATALSGAGMESPFGKGFHVIVREGTASLLWGGKNGTWVSPRGNRDIPFSETPGIGKYPVELWKPRELEGLEGQTVYSGQHAGNQIVEMTYATDSDETAPDSNTVGPKPAGSLFSKSAKRS